MLKQTVLKSKKCAFGVGAVFDEVAFGGVDSGEVAFDVMVSGGADSGVIPLNIGGEISSMSSKNSNILTSILTS